MSLVKGSSSYPSYPGRANFSYISLQNFTNRLHEKQTVGSARRVTRLAGSSSFDGRPRVTLLAGLAQPTINSVKARRSEHVLALLSLESQLLTRAKGSTFFSYKHSLKLTRLGGDPFARDNFSPYKQGLRKGKTMGNVGDSATNLKNKAEDLPLPKPLKDKILFKTLPRIVRGPCKL